MGDFENALNDINVGEGDESQELAPAIKALFDRSRYLAEQNDKFLIQLRYKHNNLHVRNQAGEYLTLEFPNGGNSDPINVSELKNIIAVGINYPSYLLQLYAYETIQPDGAYVELADDVVVPPMLVTFYVEKLPMPATEEVRSLEELVGIRKKRRPPSSEGEGSPEGEGSSEGGGTKRTRYRPAIDENYRPRYPRRIRYGPSNPRLKRSPFYPNMLPDITRTIMEDYLQPKDAAALGSVNKQLSEIIKRNPRLGYKLKQASIRYPWNQPLGKDVSESEYLADLELSPDGSMVAADYVAWKQDNENNIYVESSIVVYDVNGKILDETVFSPEDKTEGILTLIKWGPYSETLLVLKTTVKVDDNKREMEIQARTFTGADTGYKVIYRFEQQEMEQYKYDYMTVGKGGIYMLKTKKDTDVNKKTKYVVKLSRRGSQLVKTERQLKLNATDSLDQMTVNDDGDTLLISVNATAADGNTTGILYFIDTNSLGVQNRWIFGKGRKLVRFLTGNAKDELVVLDDKRYIYIFNYRTGNQIRRTYKSFAPNEIEHSENRRPKLFAIKLNRSQLPREGTFAYQAWEKFINKGDEDFYGIIYQLQDRFPITTNLDVNWTKSYSNRNIFDVSKDGRAVVLSANSSNKEKFIFKTTYLQ